MAIELKGENKIPSAIGRTLERMADILYPPNLYCVCCGNMIDDSRSYSLCDHCMTHIHWNLDPPLEAGGVKMIACTEYGIYERSIIFALKYDGHKYIADAISRIMEDRLRHSDWLNELNDVIIVPVPLSKERLTIRGYNQSELIGRKLAKRVNCEFLSALERIRDTRPMKSLGPAERARNIAGSMKVKEDFTEYIRNKKILLIDDFFTTGSTALECNRALREAGSDAVYVLAFSARKRIDVL